MTKCLANYPRILRPDYRSEHGCLLHSVAVGIFYISISNELPNRNMITPVVVILIHATLLQIENHFSYFSNKTYVLIVDTQKKHLNFEHQNTMFKLMDKKIVPIFG